MSPIRLPLNDKTNKIKSLIKNGTAELPSSCDALSKSSPCHVKDDKVRPPSGELDVTNTSQTTFRKFAVGKKDSKTALKADLDLLSFFAQAAGNFSANKKSGKPLPSQSEDLHSNETGLLSEYSFSGDYEISGDEIERLVMAKLDNSSPVSATTSCRVPAKDDKSMIDTIFIETKSSPRSLVSQHSTMHANHPFPARESTTVTVCSSSMSRIDSARKLTVSLKKRKHREHCVLSSKRSSISHENMEKESIGAMSSFSIKRRGLNNKTPNLVNISPGKRKAVIREQILKTASSLADSYSDSGALHSLEREKVRMYEYESRKSSVDKSTSSNHLDDREGEGTALTVCPAKTKTIFDASTTSRSDELCSGIAIDVCSADDTDRSEVTMSDAPDSFTNRRLHLGSSFEAVSSCVREATIMSKIQIRKGIVHEMSTAPECSSRRTAPMETPTPFSHEKATVTSLKTMAKVPSSSASDDSLSGCDLESESPMSASLTGIQVTALINCPIEDPVVTHTEVDREAVGSLTGTQSPARVARSNDWHNVVPTSSLFATDSTYSTLGDNTLTKSTLLSYSAPLLGREKVPAEIRNKLILTSPAVSCENHSLNLNLSADLSARCSKQEANQFALLNCESERMQFSLGFDANFLGQEATVLTPKHPPKNNTESTKSARSEASSMLLVSPSAHDSSDASLDSTKKELLSHTKERTNVLRSTLDSMELHSPALSNETRPHPLYARLNAWIDVSRKVPATSPDFFPRKTSDEKHGDPLERQEMCLLGSRLLAEKEVNTNESRLERSPMGNILSPNETCSPRVDVTPISSTADMSKITAFDVGCAGKSDLGQKSSFTTELDVNCSSEGAQTDKVSVKANIVESASSSTSMDSSNDTVDTMLLVDVMANLNDEINKTKAVTTSVDDVKGARFLPSLEHKGTIDNRNGCSSIPRRVEDTDREDHNCATRGRQMTADTSDFQDLLALRDELLSGNLTAGLGCATADLDDGDESSLCSPRAKRYPKCLTSRAAETFDTTTYESDNSRAETIDHAQKSSLLPFVHTASPRTILHQKETLSDVAQNALSLSNDSHSPDEYLSRRDSATSPRFKVKIVVPTSILNSTHKRKCTVTENGSPNQKRNVAFRSPEAAEYNIGSPSMRITPMPTKQVMARFAIPPSIDSLSTNGSIFGLEKECLEVGEPTLQLEAAINDLLSNLTCSTESSPLQTKLTGPQYKLSSGVMTENCLLMDGEETVELEKDMNSLLQMAVDRAVWDAPSLSLTDAFILEKSNDTQSLNDDTHFTPLDETDLEETSRFMSDVLNKSDQSMYSMSTEASTQQQGTDFDDGTIELERGIEAVLEKASHHMTYQNSTSSPLSIFSKVGDKEEEFYNSLDMLDTNSQPNQQLLNVNSPLNEEAKATNGGTFRAQPAESINITETEVLDGTENYTVELESNLMSLVDNAVAIGDESTVSAVANVPETLQADCINSNNNLRHLHFGAEVANISVDKDTVDFSMDVETNTEEQKIDLKTNVLSPLVASDSENKYNDSREERHGSTETVQLEAGQDKVVTSTSKSVVIREYASATVNTTNLQQFKKLSELEGKENKKSKRRVSLAPEGGVALTTDGELVIAMFQDNTVSETIAGEKKFIETCQLQLDPEPGLKTKPVYLSWDELCVAARPFDFVETKPSILLSFMRAACAECRNSTIVTTSSDFLSDVCGEVEGNTDCTALGNQENLNFIIEVKEKEMHKLQKMLLTPDRPSKMGKHIKNALAALAKVTDEAISTEWIRWEMQVVSALISSIANVADGIHEDEKAIDSHMTLVNNMHEGMSVMSGNEVTKARRRSISRLKSVVSSVEDEVRNLELLCQTAEAECFARKSKLDCLNYWSESLRRKSFALSNLRKNYDLSKSYMEQTESVKRFHNWTVVILKAFKISIAYEGISKKTNMILTFEETETGAISCLGCLTLQEKQFRPSARVSIENFFSPNVTEYIHNNMMSLCTNVSSRHLKSFSDMSTMIQYVEWRIARLQKIANELAQLENKYGGVLRLNRKGTYEFSLHVGTCLQFKELYVLLHIADSYPFSPIELEIDHTDSSMIVNALKRHLTKSAKPGFGYLSRACDIVFAFLQ